MIYGYDVSHHQGNFDHARARREGMDFAILKATEGATFVDDQFARNLQQAQLSGLLVAAYHYQRAGVSAAAQAEHISRVVPAGVPVILDVEANGGDARLTRDLTAELHRRGHTTPLLYLPRWYWQQIGSPSLKGLPPLWLSRYADYKGGTARGIWARISTWWASNWGGYGGLKVALAQFSSSATVAGRSPIDVNAYRGTRAQLAELFGGTAHEEDDMPLTDADVRRIAKATADIIDERHPTWSREEFAHAVWNTPLTGPWNDGTTKATATDWLTRLANRVRGLVDGKPTAEK